MRNYIQTNQSNYTLALSEIEGNLCEIIYKQIKLTTLASPEIEDKLCKIVNNFKLTNWENFEYVTQNLESFK